MGDILRKNALSGDLVSLYTLTQMLVKRKNSKHEMLAVNMLADAYHKIPGAEMKLGKQLLAGGNFFEQDHDLAIAWMALSSADSGTEKAVEAPKTIRSALPAEPTDKGPEKEDLPAFRRIDVSEGIDPLEELHKLIGLDNVKNEVAAHVKRVEFGVIRKKAGLPVTEVSAHFVFSGNPGTGKTTVARIFGSLLKKAGCLQSGHVIEVSVPDLVGRFVGETPQKVTAACNAAVGGVLFIDEAYGLLSSEIGRGDAFGEQAITTLLKFMEDNRNNIVVIAAGYPEKMEKFLSSNPGFKSRFTEIISFKDYSQAELYKIYSSCLESHVYTLSGTADTCLFEIMGEAPGLFVKDFPNGRFVRNLFEDTVKYMALRVMKGKNVSGGDLVTILEEDIVHAFKETQATTETTAQSEGRGTNNNDRQSYDYD